MEKELEWAASALAAAFGSDGGCGAGETAVSAADMVRWGECSTGPIVFFFFFKGVQSCVSGGVFRRAALPLHFREGDM